MNTEENLVIRYEELTISLVNSLKNDNVDLFYDLVSERESIIFQLKEFTTLNFSKEFKKKIKLQALEGELNKLIQNKLREYKISMDNLSKNKEAHNAYNDYFKKVISFNTKA